MDELPDLSEAILDSTEAARLFQDLEALARILEVRGRAAPGVRGSALEPTLKAAQTALASGQSVQIRYAHDGQAWCDTLMPAGEGIRVVRIRIPG